MNIEKIEGIGPSYAQKLRVAGIRTTEGLLKAGATSKGRDEICDKCRIGHSLVLEWVNLADLMRVKGVGEEYSDLLEEAGVDTVKELRNRNSANLHQSILKTNEEKSLVRKIPSEKQVSGWINQAKSLPPIVTY